LSRNWRRFWPAADAATMTADAVSRVETAISEWGLEQVEPLGGGDVALVCAAEREGLPVVLKVHPRGHHEERDLSGEAVALRAWSACGAAVQLLGSGDGDLTLLLERLSPGPALDATEIPGDERLRILAGLAARLHAGAPRAPRALATLAEYGASWRDRLGDDPGAAEFDRLLAESSEEALLHGDLHGGNALRHGDTWVAIDPHGVRGDRHADVWALIDPLSPVLAREGEAVMDAVATYADAAALDPLRAARWARLRATAEASEIAQASSPSAEEREWEAGLRRFAVALANV
jgi:streptomycin 6-kinase